MKKSGKAIYTGKGNQTGLIAPNVGTECEIERYGKCSCGCGQDNFIIIYPEGYKNSFRSIGYQLFSEDCFEFPSDTMSDSISTEVSRPLVKTLVVEKIGTEKDKYLEEERVLKTNADF